MSGGGSLSCCDRGSLACADDASYGADEGGGVVTDAVLEDDFGFFDVLDFLGRIAGEDDEVGGFAGFDGPDGGFLAHVACAVEGGDLDGFDGGEAGFDQQLE